ncbi:MAG: protein kinase [Planctomycetes bacterium]|nr:protein kinase [Planctomycetota bacterium]
MTDSEPESVAGIQARFRATAGATLPGHAFGAEALLQGEPVNGMDRTVSDGASSSGVGRPAPVLDRRTLADRLGDLPPELARGSRYLLGKLLGSGGSGRVFAVRDRDCARDVALKVLHGGGIRDPDRLARFIVEAQVTSRLEHPGILPVYDIDVSSDGDVYFTMRKIDGMSLGECIALARDGAVPVAIASISDRVAVILRVAEAVAFAHHREVIHQDIKPDNIMLGAFGEVVLVDWGTAIGSGSVTSAGALAGTPLYMSPEQASRQAADERSDVYCIAATLFHLLFLRPPTWDDDPRRFWEKKRFGLIDAPTAAERAAVPDRLLDIVLKAMDPERGRRYRGAAELVSDLKAWQDGRAITARRDTVLDRLRRFTRRNRPVVITGALSLAALLLVAGLLWREKQREYSRWSVVATEDFAGGDAALTQRWSATRIVDTYSRAVAVPIDQSFWSVRDGAAYSDGSSAQITNLSWAGALSGDLRVEWTVTPISGSSNVNCYIGARNRIEGYVFHLGGYGINTSITLTKGPAAEILVRRALPAPLAASRAYRMRMERAGDTLRYAIDGVEVIEYSDIDMLSGPEHQSFGFETAGTTLTIDDVRISTRPLPLRSSPLTAPDALYAERLYSSARERYEVYLLHHPDGDEVAVARYRVGRCLASEGRDEEAIAMFATCEREHPGDEVATDAIVRRASLLLKLDREGEARSAYAELARRPCRIFRMAARPGPPAHR